MIGKHVQNYEIKSHLGEGGMGTVFRASDSVLNRDVALKMLHAPLLQQPLFLERFKKEARVLAQLLHPNIAVIYNMIEQDNNHFMVMEYVEGNNLDALLRQYKILSYKIVVPVIVQALEGLGHAHKKGIFHRDIKPSNIILKPDGTVKLMDFGIAMVAGEQRLTQVNRVVGTVEYIAPEIIQGKEPSNSTDLYAMGVTMYELLTGKLPFEGTTDYNLMQDILKKKPLAVDRLNTTVPKKLSDIVMKILEKRPGDRYADAREFQQALINAFPELKYAELTEAYIVAASQNSTAPTMPLKRATPMPTEVLQTKLAAISKGFPALGRFKDKVLAKENRVITICASVVLLTAILALAFMPGSGNSSSTGSTDTTAVTQQPETKTPVVVTKPEENQNIPVVDNRQTTFTPVDAPETPKNEDVKKKKTPIKDKGNTKDDAKKNEGEENSGDKGSEKKDETVKKDEAVKGDDAKGTDKKEEENKDKDVKSKKDDKTISFEELFKKKKKDPNDNKTPGWKKLKSVFKKN